MKTISYIKAVALTLLFTSTFKAPAQINPMSSTYFQNQYLGNPAMAGIEKGIVINGNYRQLWSNVPGAPATQIVTGEYAFTNKTALGLNFSNDKAGLLRNTRTVATYAYHLPLSNENKLNFGVSLGFANQRLENSEIRGDLSDGNIGRFNSNKTYLDADFGVAYTGKKLTLQGTLPNLKSVFNDEISNTVDRSTFFSAVSYKMTSGALGGLELEPKVCYRGVKNQDNVLDLGTRLSFSNNQIYSMMMYHSTQSATFGLGLNYRSSLAITGMYSTSTSAFSNYSNGSFEIGIRGSIF
jgi:type IX secretion system PorP/SprF family membrane protein